MTLRLSRPPADDDELWWLFKAMIGVEFPRVQVCEDHVSPFDAISHAFFSKEPNFAVWYASRGSGKSLALAALGLAKAFVADIDVTILGGSMTQSLNVREHMRKLMAYENFPDYAVAKDTATLIEMTTGRQVRPLPASETTVRGPHPPLQLLDEIDEMDYGIYNSSLGQAMEQKNHHGETILEYVVASSTWQNPEGTMTKVIDDARQRGLPVFTWCISTGSYIDKADGTKEQIQRLQPGDLVATRQGPRRVQHVSCTGYRPTVRVQLSNGSSLVCTPDHRIAVPGGFAEASTLRPGSLVIARARPAVPAVVAGGDVGVLGRVLVSGGTVGTPGLIDDVGHTPGVLSDAGRLEMVGVDARRVAADDVVQTGSGVGSSDQPPDGSVRELLSQPDTAADRPVTAMSASALPLPAPPVGDHGSSADVVQVEDDLGTQRRPDDGLLDADPAVPGGAVGTGLVAGEAVHVVNITPGAYAQTWDIGVEDAHEFVAEGVVVHNCWRELLEPNGWMTKRFIENKRRTVSAQMWHTEYDLNEPAAGGRAVDLDKVAEYFLPPSEYGETISETHRGNGDHDVYVWEEPESGGSYAVGADWAKEQDKTVISVVRYDTKPYTLVKLTRVNRMPWDAIIAMFNDDIEHYQAVGFHDKTGLGSVVNDYVDFSDTTKGFVMVGRPRTQMLLDYITSFEHGDYRLPHIPKRDQASAIADDPMYRAHRSTTVADVYAPGKWNTHLPDDFSSMALLHRAISTLPQPTTTTSGVRKDGSVREVDKPFNLDVEVEGEVISTDGDVTVVDQRYRSGSEFIVDREDDYNPWEAMNV